MISYDMDTTLDDVVQNVRNELDSKEHLGLQIGYAGDTKLGLGKRSVRSVNEEDGTFPPRLGRHRSSAVTTITAVTASVVGVVALVACVVLLASLIHRRKTLGKNITV